MSLEALAYVSSAVGAHGEPELEALLQTARARNRQVRVTGVLLHHEGNFFQYIEGPPRGVQDVYDRILASPLHQGIIELMRSPILERAFCDWQMGFTRVPKSEILRLSNASWIAGTVDGAAPSQVSDGVGLLLTFWKVNTGQPAG